MVPQVRARPPVAPYPALRPPTTQLLTPEQRQAIKEALTITPIQPDILRAIKERVARVRIPTPPIPQEEIEITRPPIFPDRIPADVGFIRAEIERARPYEPQMSPQEKTKYESLKQSLTETERLVPMPPMLFTPEERRKMAEPPVLPPGVERLKPLEIAKRFVNWLSPGYLERTKIQLVEPLAAIPEAIRAILPAPTAVMESTAIPGFERHGESVAEEVRNLLGPEKAEEFGHAPSEPLSNLVQRAGMGALYAWFDIVGGIFKRVDDIKNAALSVFFRQVEKTPNLAMLSFGLPGTQGPLYPAGIREELYRGMEEEGKTNPLLNQEELKSAIDENEMVWSMLTLEPSLKKDLRDKVASGELTMEDLMRDYRNDNLELAMNLITTPWWYIPLGPAGKVMFAPITVPLSLAWRGLKAMPVINTLVELSKRAKVERYADEAAKFWERAMTRMPGWVEQQADTAFSGGTKFELGQFFENARIAAEKGDIARVLGVTDDVAARLQAFIEFAERGGFDLSRLMATAGTKDAVLGYIKWIARQEKAAELGVNLVRDRHFMGETMQFMKEMWLSTSPSWGAVNFLDNSTKSLSHGFFPHGNFATRFGRFGLTMPDYVNQTLATAGIGLEARTVTGRLGIPLISKPENWMGGYLIGAIERFAGKEATKPVVKFLGPIVDYTKRPELSGLGRAIKWTLDHANLESLVMAGRAFWNMEYAFRAEGVLHRLTGIVETSRPQFADDAYKAIVEAGYPEDVAMGIKNALSSRLVKSPADINRIFSRLYPGGKPPVYGLTDYPIQYSGKLAGVLEWLSTNLARLETSGKATTESVEAQFDDALRIAQKTIDDVQKVADDEVPISKVFTNLNDIIAVQRARHRVALGRIDELIHRVRQRNLAGDLPDKAVDDCVNIANKAIYRANKIVSQAFKKTDQARIDMIDTPLAEARKALQEGRIDLAQYSLRYSQLIKSYLNYSRPYWDKMNDDYVRMLAAAMERVQGRSGLFTEPLSMELAARTARLETNIQGIKAAWREQILGEWLDDARNLTDEIAKWREWALAKIEGAIPEERVAEAVAPEVARPAEGISKAAGLVEQFTNRWRAMIENARDEGTRYSEDIFFNYGNTIELEEKIRWAFPFVHWQLLNPLYWLKHAQEMPWIPNAIRLYEWETDQHRLKRGLTARFKWTVEAPLDEWVPSFFPEGYYGTDFRPFMSLLTQVGLFTPYGEPWRWGEEDAAGKLIRASEWIGITPYPWWQAIEASVTKREMPDLGSLFPITRAVRDLFDIDLGHITEIEDYYANLELAARVADGEIDEWRAKNAIMQGAGNPDYDSALDESQDIAKKFDLIRLFLPFTIKYASPGEEAIRQEIMERAGMPRAERPEPSPGLSTYYFIRLSPEDQKRALAYESYIDRINNMNKWLSAQAQFYGIGTKKWQAISDKYWEDRERIANEYEETVTPEMTQRMRWLLANPLDSAVRSYRNMTRQFFDEEGDLKEGYEWADVISAQEMFKRELVRGTPERRPISLLAFEQARRKWEIPEEAMFRAWEELYARPIYEVISSTRDMEDRDEANALIAQAKTIANSGRDNKSELMAEVIRIHPDWTRAQVARAISVKLPEWDAWARRNDPLKDAVVGIIWNGYMGLSDLGRRQFRQFLETTPEIDPAVSLLFQEIMLPRERIGAEETKWQRDLGFMPIKALLIIADYLGALQPLAREGFRAEIEEAEKEYELGPGAERIPLPTVAPPTELITGPFTPMPQGWGTEKLAEYIKALKPEVRQALLEAMPMVRTAQPQPPAPGEIAEMRYGREQFRPPAPEESAAYDKWLGVMTQYQNVRGTNPEQARAFWEANAGVLEDRRFYSPGASSQFWDFYYGSIPPGKIASEIRNDPIVSAIVNRQTRKYLNDAGFAEGLRRMQAWAAAHPEIVSIGNSQEWVRVREIVAQWSDLRDAGREDEARALWNQYGDLLGKYYGGGARRRFPPAGVRPRRFGGGGGRWVARAPTGGEIQTFFNRVIPPLLQESLANYWTTGAELSAADLAALRTLYERSPMGAATFEQWLNLLRQMWQSSMSAYVYRPRLPYAYLQRVPMAYRGRG